MAWDAVWEDVFSRQAWGKYPGEDVIRFVARNFYGLDRANVKLLEVGSGPGANVWYMARESFDVYGIDGSKAAIEQCQSRLHKNGLKAHVQVGDIVDLPYDDNMFDGVLDVECLCCNDYQNSDQILQQIHRVLKPGGKFYSRTFTDHIYTGKTHEKLSEFEYNNVSDGPFADKGFIRLTPREHIAKLYGQYFDIMSVDKLECSANNQEYTISEWLISCQKAD